MLKVSGAGEDAVRALIRACRNAGGYLGRMGDAAVTTRVVEAVRNSNAIHASLSEAREFVGRGVAALDTLRVPSGGHLDSLRDIADYVVSRDL